MPAAAAACREGREFVSGHLLRWGVPERIVDVAVLITRVAAIRPQNLRFSRDR